MSATKEKKSTPFNADSVCPYCDSENVKRVSGISGDYFIGNRYQAVDVTNYECLDCKERWSD